MEGQPFDRMSFSITVMAQDQWRCHTRAMAIARACYRKMGLAARDIPEPLWESLEHPSKSRVYTNLREARRKLRERLMNVEG